MKTVEIDKVNVSSYPDIRFKQSWHQSQLPDKKTILCVSVVEVLFIVFTALHITTSVSFLWLFVKN